MARSWRRGLVLTVYCLVLLSVAQPAGMRIVVADGANNPFLRDGIRPLPLFRRQAGMSCQDLG